MPKRTQRDRVIHKLWDNETVCATTFWALKPPIPAARNRISELRAEGWLIDTETCDNEWHQHDDHQIQYRKRYSIKCLCPRCKQRFPREPEPGGKLF